MLFFKNARKKQNKTNYSQDSQLTHEPKILSFNISSNSSLGENK